MTDEKTPGNVTKRPKHSTRRASTTRKELRASKEQNLQLSALLLEAVGLLELLVPKYTVDNKCPTIWLREEQAMEWLARNKPVIAGLKETGKEGEA